MTRVHFFREMLQIMTVGIPVLLIFIRQDMRGQNSNQEHIISCCMLLLLVFVILHRKFKFCESHAGDSFRFMLLAKFNVTFTFYHVPSKHHLPRKGINSFLSTISYSSALGAL